MGSGPSSISAYGFSKKECIASLQAHLLFEYKATLYQEKVDTQMRYYIFYAGEHRYVQTMQDATDKRLWKAIIVL